MHFASAFRFRSSALYGLRRTGSPGRSRSVASSMLHSSDLAEVVTIDLGEGEAGLDGADSGLELDTWQRCVAAPLETAASAIAAEALALLPAFRVQHEAIAGGPLMVSNPMRPHQQQ